MNAVLERILTTASVTDGEKVFSLRHPEFPGRVSHVDRATGDLLRRAVLDVQPQLSLEIGLAYGVSTLFICDAIRSLPQPGRHIVLDPFQHGKWRGIGLRNVQDAGYQRIVDFHAEPSETYLPRLLEQGATLDLVFIDGLHRFDQVLVEFYFVNRLLRPGGIVLFDDAARRSVNRVLRHALTYPAYEVWDSTEHPLRNRSTLGRIRRFIGQIPAAQRLLRTDILQRDWDLNLLGRCVALKKSGPDRREVHWDADF
jgi:predicted O-methyltransferase YrrM